MTKYLLATSTAVLMGIAFAASPLRAEESSDASSAHAPNPTEVQEKHSDEVKGSAEAEKHVDGEHAKKHHKKHHCKHCKKAKKHHSEHHAHSMKEKGEHEGKAADEQKTHPEKAPTDAAEPTKAAAETHEK